MAALECGGRGHLLVDASENDLAEAAVPAAAFGRRAVVVAVGSVAILGAALAAVSMQPPAAVAPIAGTSVKNAVRLFGNCGQVECDCSWAVVPGSCQNEALGGQRCYSCCCEFHHDDYHQDAIAAPASSYVVYHGDHAHVPVYQEPAYQDPVPHYHGDAYHGSVYHGDTYHGTVYPTYPTLPPHYPDVAGHYPIYVMDEHELATVSPNGNGNWFSWFHFDAHFLWWVIIAIVAVLVIVGVYLLIRTTTPKHYISAAPPPPLPSGHW